MERRNLPGHAQMPELERIWNQPSNPHINIGNGALTMHADNSVVCNHNSGQSSNTGGRIGAHQVPNYRPEAPNHMSNNIASSYNRFTPFAGFYAQFPSEYVQHGPYYNQVGAREGNTSANPQMDYQRTTNKRKFEAISDVARGNTNTNYYVGSSSNIPSSADHAQIKPMLVPQYSRWDPNYFVPSHISNDMLPPEGSQGTVRRQYSNGIHLGTSSAIAPSSNTPHDYLSGANTLRPVARGQWNHTSVPLVPHATLTFSGNGAFNHEMVHPQGVAYISSGSVDVAEEHNSSFIRHRNSIPSPFLTGPSARGVINNQDCFNQGTGYRTNMNHPPLGLAVNSDNARIPGIEPIRPPRFLRPIEVVRHRNESNGRLRNHGRLPAFTDEDNNAHSRWVSEGVSMMDQLAYVDLRNLYDEHREMRLDIDDMSYEELLALGERIGSVSTGLSEDAASKCLRLTTCCPDRIMDETVEHNCAICLEAYKEREQVGRLNCSHDFHANCITKWLLIKNVCPICKASASTEQ